MKAGQFLSWCVAIPMLDPVVVRLPPVLFFLLLFDGLAGVLRLPVGNIEDETSASFETKVIAGVESFAA